MPQEVIENWDPLGGNLPPEAEEYRRSREAENVLGSYFHATDLLAEALQNAADAVDAQAELEEGEDEQSPRTILLRFDCRERCFSVADTGTGMSRDALDIVFRPNITMKSGPLAPPSSRSWRGEKGVGLSFLLFSCDELRIRTCDGEHRYDAEIKGAAAWAANPEASRQIEARLEVSDPDTHLGSDHYTVVTLGAVDVDLFERDLFEMVAGEVEWTMRTRTAVGNTACLFADLEAQPVEEIDVHLHYRGADGEESKRRVPYRYATPEELLARAEELGVTDPITVYDFEDLEGLDGQELRRKLTGAAVRYVALYETRTERKVAVYMFAMAGDAMREILDELQERDEVDWAPSEWSGFWVATRDMPTGVALSKGILPTRTYEQRLFGLLQFDELKLDVGRKSLHGRTSAMFREVIKNLWAQDMRWVVERIPRAHQGRGAGALEIKRRLDEAGRLADLEMEVPFAKAPDREAGVAAIFHELLGARSDRLPELHGITTGVLGSSDLLASNGGGSWTGNGTEALHVVFGLDQIDVLKIFDSGTGAAETVELAVLWRLLSQDEDEDSPVAQITVEKIEEVDGSGVTHLLHFSGLGGRDVPLRVIVLSNEADGE